MGRACFHTVMHDLYLKRVRPSNAKFFGTPYMRPPTVTHSNQVFHSDWSHYMTVKWSQARLHPQPWPKFCDTNADARSICGSLQWSGIKKLERWGHQVENKTVWLYLKPFWHKTQVWQTDGYQPMANTMLRYDQTALRQLHLQDIIFTLLRSTLTVYYHKNY